MRPNNCHHYRPPSIAPQKCGSIYTRTKFSSSLRAPEQLASPPATLYCVPRSVELLYEKQNFFEFEGAGTIAIIPGHPLWCPQNLELFVREPEFSSTLKAPENLPSPPAIVYCASRSVEFEFEGARTSAIASGQHLCPQRWWNSLHENRISLEFERARTIAITSGHSLLRPQKLWSSLHEKHNSFRV